MRRVILAAAGTISGLIMLLSFKTHSTTAALRTITPAGGTTGTTAGGTTSATTGAGTAAPAPAAPATTAPATGTKTVTGAAVDTRYGPVQVQITVTNGQVTAVNATEYPTSRSHDQQINSYAIPQLNQEAAAAKSAQIDMVSGATYTSTGYISSLQSALSKAGVA